MEKIGKISEEEKLLFPKLEFLDDEHTKCKICNGTGKHKLSPTTIKKIIHFRKEKALKCPICLSIFLIDKHTRGTRKYCLECQEKLGYRKYLMKHFSDDKTEEHKNTYRKKYGILVKQETNKKDISIRKIHEESEKDLTRLLNYKETSNFLGIKISTLYSLVCRKQIPHHRFSSRLVRFHPKELSQWIEDNKVNPKGD